MNKKLKLTIVFIMAVFTVFMSSVYGSLSVTLGLSFIGLYVLITCALGPYIINEPTPIVFGRTVANISAIIGIITLCYSA